MPNARIETRSQLDDALGAARFLLLKHSPRCGISRAAFRAYTAFLEEHPTIPHAWVDVVEDRPLSQVVTERTGIGHESPQAFWIIDGRVSWSATHFDITTDALAAAVTDSIA